MNNTSTKQKKENEKIKQFSNSKTNFDGAEIRDLNELKKAIVDKKLTNYDPADIEAIVLELVEKFEAWLENKKETICRVNISITPELHERYKELAKSHFGSFSHLVREAIEYMINRAEGGGYRAELTPVIERLDTLLKHFGAFEKSVVEMKSSLKVMVSSEVGEERRIASGVQGVLSREEGLTIQEIAEKSRLSIREVTRGLGVLEDNFLVEREEPANLAGFIRWKIKR